MPVKTRALLLALCLSVAMPGFAADPAPVSAPAPALAAATDIRGHVVDAAGKPVADADIWLCRVSNRPAAASIVAQARSAADGSFAFSAPAAPKGTSYSVIARHAAQGANFANLATSGAANPDLTIALSSFATTQATVTDTAGRPVADAEVFLVRAEPKAGGQAARRLHLPGNVGIFAAKSDNQGKVQLSIPADCVAHLVARKPGFADAQGTDKLVLCPGGNITGTVTYSDGTPAPNMLVSYLYAGGRGSLESFTVTDTAGRYHLKDVAAEGYYLADAPADDGDPFANVGHITAGLDDPAESSPDVSTTVSESADVKPKATLTKNLMVPKIHELSGAVVDAATGKPLSGVQVYVHAYSSNGGRTSANRSLTTDKQGRFRTGIVHGASANINVMPGGSLLLDESAQSTTYQNLQNVRSDTREITFRLKFLPTRSLTGRLVGPDGKGLAGTIYSDPRVPPVPTPDGAFTLAQVPADRPVPLCAVAGAFGGTTVVKPDQQQITFQLQPLVERQVTFTTASGNPVPDLAITCYPKAGNVQWYQAQITASPTDASGTTRIQGLIPGLTYALNWNSPNDAVIGQGGAPLTVTPDEPAQPLKITVKEYTHTLTGKVVNSKGEPVANAHFQFRDYSMFRNNDWGRASGTSTKADGSFRFEYLTDGFLEGQIYAGNYRQLSFSIPTNSTDAKLVLHTQQEPARHEVFVCDEQGAPLADTPVIIAYRQDNSGKSLQEPSTTDADGVVDLSGISSRQGISVICDLDGFNLAAVHLQEYNEGRQRLMVTPTLPAREVRVVDDAGNPLPNIDVRVNSFGPVVASGMHGEQAQLYLWPQELLAATGMVQKTDAAGRVAFPRVSHKQHISLNLSSRTYGDQYKDLQPSDTDAPTEIRLSIPGTLSGKVILPPDAKADLTKYHVQLNPTQSGRGYQGNVRPDGTFTITTVVPGTYNVGLQTWGSVPALSKYKLAVVAPVTIDTGKTATLELVLKEGIRIRGRLDYKRAADAKGNAQVYLEDEATHVYQNYPTDAAGNFELYVPAPGEYQFMYALPGTDSKLRQLPPVRVPSTQPIDDLVLKVPG